VKAIKKKAAQRRQHIKHYLIRASGGQVAFDAELA